MAERYNDALVLFSVLIAVVTAFASFDLIDRILAAKRRTAAFQILASFVIGLGIWSMHFIGMLAYQPGVPVTYQIPYLLLSLLLPIAASYAAVFMIIARSARTAFLIAGGVYVGLSIAAMHYVGMESMKMPAVMKHHPLAVVCSTGIALLIPFCCIYLSIRYKASQLQRIPLWVKIVGALPLGLGFAAIHYSAMAGTSVVPIGGERLDYGQPVIGNATLAVLVGGAVLFILATVLTGAFLDRHRALRFAREQERRYISLFENSPDMVICYDPDENTIVSANPAVYRATGYMPDEVDAATLKELYKSESEMAAVREQYRRSAEDSTPRQLELSIVDKIGRMLLISVTFFPLDLDGKRYIYSIGRDITEQRKAEEELRRAKEEAERGNHMKGEFLALMSHEIRTPLNGMIGINQIMMETELSDKQREMMIVQEKSGQALLRVINDVLDFSKIESGTVVLSDELFHLEGCLKDSIESFSVGARNKGIDLSYRVEGAIPELVHGDPIRLRQILVNLVGNAVKFTESGSVLLEARKIEHAAQPGGNGPVMEFKVTDTGIGIDPAKVHLLFLPFSQLMDASRGRHYEGTGLGLAICRDLVQLMGGDIWVEAGRKQGACFGFRIPFRMPDTGG